MQFGKVGSSSETNPVVLSDRVAVLKQYRKPCKGNNCSPQLPAIISMQGMSTSIKIVVSESLAGSLHSLQPLPGESLIENRLNHRGEYRKRCKKSEDTL